MEWTNYIESNPDVLLGKPIIKGTRISVELILELYSKGWSHQDILQSYPHLKKESLLAAVEYANLK